MQRAWARNRLPGRILALGLLVIVCPAIAAAQQPAKARPTPVPRQIILPAKLVAGAQATLAVLDSQGRLLPDVTVDLPGGQKVTTDITGRAIFKAGDQPGTLLAKVSGHSVTATADVLAADAPGVRLVPGEAPGSISVASHPHVLAIHDRFSIEGSGFRGAADSNQVNLNGDQCLVLASSPVSLVVLPGLRAPVGDTTLHLTVAGTDAGQYPVSVVLLELSGPAETVNAGATGQLTLHAHGTAQPLLVEVRNGSPGVVQLSKGNVQRLKTSGGEQNSAAIDVKFVTGGNYSVTARLLSSDDSQPDLHAVGATSHLP
jgi:hypothetical protein